MSSEIQLTLPSGYFLSRKMKYVPSHALCGWMDEILTLALCGIVAKRWPSLHDAHLNMFLPWAKGNVERNWKNIDKNTQEKESSFLPNQHWHKGNVDSI